MRQTLELPKTLQQAVAFLSAPQQTFDYAVKLRWPDGKPLLFFRCYLSSL
jgi:hypothetical protein